MQQGRAGGGGRAQEAAAGRGGGVGRMRGILVLIPVPMRGASLMHHGGVCGRAAPGGPAPTAARGSPGKPPCLALLSALLPARRVAGPAMFAEIAQPFAMRAERVVPPLASPPLCSATAFCFASFAYLLTYYFSAG